MNESNKKVNHANIIKQGWLCAKNIRQIRLYINKQIRHKRNFYNSPPQRYNTSKSINIDSK